MDELRKKVISALQGEVDSAAYMGHSFKDCVPVRHLLDALSLLKAQEPVEPIEMINDFYPIGDPRRTEGWKCGKCGQRIAWDDNYCSKCGTAVKWVE